MKKKNPGLFRISAILLALIVFSACVKEKQQGPVIVKIGNEALTIEDLRMSIPAPMQDKITRDELQDYVNRWINLQILYQQGVEQGVDRRVDIRRQLKAFEVSLVGNAYLDSTLSARFSVSDSAVASFYEENKESFMRNSDELYLQQIFVSSKATADSLWNTLQSGSPFDSVASQFAKADPEGFEWNLGYVSDEDLGPEIINKLKFLRPGRIARPIETIYGFHIFKIIDKQPKGTLRDLVSVKNDIVTRLQQDVNEENYRQLMSRLKSNAKIETNFDLLNRISMDSLFTFQQPVPQKNQQE